MKRSMYPLFGLGLRNLFELSPLEKRLLMCVDDFAHAHADGQPDIGNSPAVREVPRMLDLSAGPALAGSDSLTLEGSAAAALSSLPALSSKPGSADTIYLDFDGHFESLWGAYSNITTPAFDTDGDATTFSDSELAAIQQIWKYVAEDYAPFDVNVTTVQPASFANGVGLRVSIGGDGAWIGKPGGVAYVDSYTNFIANTVYVFPKNLANGYAKYVGEASSHESGHAFGLQHQSSYSGTTKTNEYYAGSGDGRAPILGNSYSAVRGLWWRGTSSTSSTSIQDDMAVISKPTNFGYRVDDHGNSSGSATALTLDAAGQASGTGLISQISDVDYFAFTTGAGGAASFSLDVDAGYNNLDARLELRRADGSLLASAAPSTSFGATISTTLTAGTYYLVAASNGAYGDVGQYSISGSISGVVAPLGAPSGLQASLSGTQVNLSWTDNSGENEDGFRIERSSNGGGSWSQVGTAGKNSTAWSDLSAVAGSSYSYRVIAYQGQAASQASNAASVTLRPAAPANLVATAASSTQISLTWSDVAGETGYTIERSTTGTGSWSQIGSIGAGTTSYQSTGLIADTTYFYRVRAANAGGSSDYSANASARTLAVPTVPSAPSGLAATVISSRRIDLRWTDNSSNEQGFRIYRSTNGGGSWSQVGTAGQNATTWSDTSTSRRKTYQYRIRAYNSVGNSAYSNTVSATTPRNSLPVLRLFTSRSDGSTLWADLDAMVRR